MTGTCAQGDESKPRQPVLSILGAALLVACNTGVQAGESSTGEVSPALVEFEDVFMLGKTGAGADVSRFAMRNSAAPGRYRVDIYVNQQYVTRREVQFKVDERNETQPCFDKVGLQSIGVDLNRLAFDGQQKFSDDHGCIYVQNVAADASSSFDLSELKLDLSIPQAIARRDVRGYVNPEYWDSGVTAGILGYDFNLYRTNAGTRGTHTQGYFGLRLGANLGDWRFRHEGSYTFDSKGRQKYQDILSHAQRDLPALRSQLIIGDGYTSGDLFDSASFRGVMLINDDRMLPESLHGYAPVVRGVAFSNAKVMIRQNGVLIYETIVTPGAFEIDDLYATGYGGDLNVDIQEADGSHHSFSVPYAALPASLRMGRSRYYLAAGAVRDQQLSSAPVFAQGTWQHGFTNLFTGYGGGTIANRYVSVMAGGAFNTPFGAIGLDITHAMTSLKRGRGNLSGSSLRASYMKHFSRINAHVAIAAYRYSTGGFFGLTDAMRERDRENQSLSFGTVLRQQSRSSLTVSQGLGEKLGQLSITGSTINYWNRDGTDINYSIGYNNSYKNIGYNIAVVRQYLANNKAETLYFASVTIPIGTFRPMTLSSNITRNTTGRTQSQTSISGTLGVDNAVSYGLTASVSGKNDNTAASGNASILYHSPYADFKGNVGAAAGYSQESIGVRGALIAHQEGVILSQPTSETIGIVAAPGAEGARIINMSGLRINSRGYAVIPYLTPYSMNSVSIDPKGTSTDVELKVTEQHVAPRAGSVALIKFETVVGRSALVAAKRSDGVALPFGASVLDEAGNEVGVVGQGSNIFLRGFDPTSILTVKWGNDMSSQCRLAYSIPAHDASLKPDHYDGVDGICNYLAEIR
ncbi:fimbrial biogenesis outer membrane usher protein [Burkholderia sp. JSH-S8]|nr:fimbrial biogenesis outer membrane usher protein [Burkholderia sp. JSH-S8]